MRTVRVALAITRPHRCLRCLRLCLRLIHALNGVHLSHTRSVLVLQPRSDVRPLDGSNAAHCDGVGLVRATQVQVVRGVIHVVTHHAARVVRRVGAVEGSGVGGEAGPRVEAAGREEDARGGFDVQATVPATQTKPDESAHGPELSCDALCGCCCARVVGVC